jgi:hypothetical protein
MVWGHARSAQTPPPTQLFEPLIQQKALKHILKRLKPSIRDLFNLARSSKALWVAVGQDHTLWRDLYLATDPLCKDNPGVL